MQNPDISPNCNRTALNEYFAKTKNIIDGQSPAKKGALKLKSSEPSGIGIGPFNYSESSDLKVNFAEAELENSSKKLGDWGAPNLLKSVNDCSPSDFRTMRKTQPRKHF